MKNNNVLVIMSGRYLDSEFTAELGQLPPAFLPIGNKRLYQRQLECFSSFEGRKYISIPNSYRLSWHDEEVLKGLKVSVIRVKDDVSINQSLIKIIETLEKEPFDNLYLLYGDTLFTKIENTSTDVFGVSQAKTNYRWATFQETRNRFTFLEFSGDRKNSENVVSGYFSFSNTELLYEALSSTGSIVEALNKYAASINFFPVQLDSWMDLGHLQNYYHSKQQITTERAFNSLERGRNSLVKSSSSSFKIEAEYNWYQALPFDIKVHTPHVGELIRTNNKCAYSIEYLPLPSLNELFVFADLPEITWDSILDQCFDFIDKCSGFKLDGLDVKDIQEWLYRDKTMERVRAFAATNNIDLLHPWIINNKRFPGVIHAVEHLIKMLDEDSCDYAASIVHGDFCFSNIFYDFRVNRLKVIDPRGTYDGRTFSIYGDFRYDYAKLMHSVVGKYDLIIADQAHFHRKSAYEIDFAFPETKGNIIENLFFEKMRQRNINTRAISAMNALLFFSMLPLHHDAPARQYAMLANAFLLYHNLK